jgi:hypothetical protein
VKKSALLATVVALVMLSTLAGSALAAPGGPPHLDWGSEVNPGQCPPGPLVINVTLKVANDIDSGVGGNYWATDAYNRHIQVWQVAANTFCAIVQYEGSFVTVDGASPGNTGTVAAGATGSFEGGYRAIITGSLNPDPAYRTRGNIGKFDYGCDPGTGNCSSAFSWPSAYFNAGYGFAYEWWGWIYHGGKNGTWVNAIDGNAGDITN